MSVRDATHQCTVERWHTTNLDTPNLSLAKFPGFRQGFFVDRCCKLLPANTEPVTCEECTGGKASLGVARSFPGANESRSPLRRLHRKAQAHDVDFSVHQSWRPQHQLRCVKAGGVNS